MDRERFDALTRLFARRGSRRSGLTAVLGVALIGHGPEPDTLAKPGKDKGHGKDRKQHRRKDRREQFPPTKANPSDRNMGGVQCAESACFLGTWGSRGSLDGQFQTPRGGGVAPDETVYIADLFNHRIQYFTAMGEYVGQWGTPVGTPGSDDGQFNNPNDVAVAADGTVYVADSLNHRIQYFTAQGGFLGKWGTQGSEPGQFNEPRFVAVGPDDTVFVSDNLNHRVQYFTPTGQYLGQWGSQGDGDGQFDMPRGITVARDGNVYVVDLNHRRIQRFNAVGKFLGKWGSQGSGDGQFQQPRFVAVGLDDTVFVSDANLNRIQRFTAAGKLLGTWGSLGNGPGQFTSPHGVEVSAAGVIYVVDSNNHRVQSFRLA